MRTHEHTHVRTDTVHIPDTQTSFTSHTLSHIRTYMYVHTNTYVPIVLTYWEIC